jgi:hypothetical protein
MGKAVARIVASADDRREVYEEIAATYGLLCHRRIAFLRRFVLHHVLMIHARAILLKVVMSY